MDSMEQFDEQQLPPKDAFFSKVHNSGISDEDYAHAQNIWKTFNLQNMRSYHDLFLMSMIDFFTFSILSFYKSLSFYYLYFNSIVIYLK